MKEIFVVIGVCLTILGYVPYFRDIFAGKTKPHAFTWLIWSALTAIAFFAQLSDGGGAGSTVLGLTAFVSFIIFIIALKVGRKNIALIDWVFLAGAIVSMAVWGLTDDPLWSVVLITVIDAVAFAPTFRKSYKDPYSETLVTYLFSGIKFIFAILALNNYSVTTVLYPLSLVLANGLFVWMLLVRRKTVKPASKIEE
jgi:hypothetical protein